MTQREADEYWMRQSRGAQNMSAPSWGKGNPMFPQGAVDPPTDGEGPKPLAFPVKIHELKCWPEYWDALASGQKRFEVRRDDRGFQRGDILVLQRCHKVLLGSYEVETDSSGRPAKELAFRVGYILTGGQFGIEPGFVVMSLDVVSLEAMQP